MMRWSGRLVYLDQGKRRTLNLLFDQPCFGPGIHTEPDWEKVGKGFIFTLHLIPEHEVEIVEIFIERALDLNKTDHVFLNGYQSWTEGREYLPNERMAQLSVLFQPLVGHYQLQYLGDGHFYPYSMKKGELHSYTYSYIRRGDGRIYLQGSLSEAEGFTIFHYSRASNSQRILKECQGLKIANKYQAFRLFVMEGEDDTVFDAYFKSMGLKKQTGRLTSGWTSWYNYYTNISRNIILDNLKNFREKKIPIQLFQIDDGYQTAVGDWLSIKDSFPGGMKPVADEIKKGGYQPGIWLAPFIAEKKSDLFRKHKSWLMKNPKGKPAVAGFNDKWGGHFYALDFYHPEAREYIRRVIQTALDDWGFEMVKLDFLYAACLHPRNGKPRGQIMAEAMDFIRETVGEKMILGCGVPLGSAFGKVDYCRIGCDVGLEWEIWNTSMVQFRERVSTANALADAIGRRHLNGRAFVNDPDVVILRDQNVQLTQTQRKTLLFINSLFGGLLFTSDNPGDYNESVLKEYRAVLKQKPAKIKSVFSHDSIYRWRAQFTLENLLFGLKPYANVYEIEFEREGKLNLAVVNLGGRGILVKLKKNGLTVEVEPYSFIIKSADALEESKHSVGWK